MIASKVVVLHVKQQYIFLTELKNQLNVLKTFTLKF